MQHICLILFTTFSRFCLTFFSPLHHNTKRPDKPSAYLVFCGQLFQDDMVRTTSIPSSLIPTNREMLPPYREICWGPYNTHYRTSAK